jgi:PAS domain S-box-containing protein
MARFLIPRQARIVLLILLVQSGLLAGTALTVWMVLTHPLDYHGGGITLLAGTILVLLLSLITSIMLAAQWRIQADRGLTVATDRFRHLVEAIDGIVWESDPVTLQFDFVSRQAERMLGYPVEAWYQDPLFWRKHLHPEDREAMIAHFDACEARLRPFTAEYRMVAADGRVVWIRDIVTVTADEGRPARLHGVMVDVTERKLVQEELERAFQEIRSREADLTAYKDHLEELVMKRSEALVRANQELRVAWQRAEESNRMKSAFLANMSHELRTPLNAIILYSELIMDEASLGGAPGAREDLEKIRSAGRHLLALIDDILDLSKIEADRLTLEEREVSIPGLIQEITGSTMPMIEKNGNRFVVEVDPAATSLRSDPLRLRQILINLLSNASKFTREGTVTLRVRFGAFPGEIQFTVEDTGIGMTREQQTRIFHRFTQADDSTTRKFGGTGLGLALSRRLAELLGGMLWVESEEGRGAAFHLRLPRRRELPPATA